ncbi:hypothetical protein [Raineyella sp. W15-4]|uniref:hypothetical protein n=1 Tax=Raineyella sp. W15-4 TaxID=3081651 RepID=UPI002955CC4A|nr:hypothetical protein [Raineyella sp. W15-4]WOQ18179.1 hypothetical protein R0145_05645 [Raineyella sp. W15-4]
MTAISAAVRSRIGRFLVAVTLAAVVGALIGATAFTAAPPARAAGGDSPITVKWAGGNEAGLQKYQPDHAALTSDGNGKDAGSGHWDDFKNLQVTVSKTTDLDTEVVRVTAKGMAPTVGDPGLRKNFLQVMQCWGPDPLAADFAKTCQFGASDQTAGFASADDLMYHTIGQATYNRYGYKTGYLPFRAVTKEESVTDQVPAPGGGTLTRNGLARFMDPSTSNELPYVPIGGDGTASVAFETQAATAAPYLGCGSPAAAGQRCWLVVVPRGTHAGEHPGATGECMPKNYDQNYAQIGSAVSPDCTYFADRLVVPLDFRDPTGNCAVGSADRAVTGTEFVAGAMSSWQSAACAATGTSFALTTNSGALSRGQLLTGQADFVVGARPVTKDTIGTTDPALLDGAEIAYAPLANTALTISYVARRSGTAITEVKLTPRLIAKLLTQSYRDLTPIVGLYPVTDAEKAAQWEGWAQQPPASIVADPEWAALGNDPQLKNFTGATGSFVVSGPFGDDAIELLWRYVLADADAVAFLSGKPDPWGNSVNPYYLPPGHPKAKGGGYDVDLSRTAIDTVPRADQTMYPSVEEAARTTKGQRVDSVTLLPFSTSLQANAQRVFRVDTRYTGIWNKLQFNSAGEAGAFAPVASEQFSESQWIVGPTTANAAAAYGLSTAQLAIPLSTTTTNDTVRTARHFAGLSTASMATAIATDTPDPATGVASRDFTRLPGDAYPLTTTLYGAVDLGCGRLDKAARTQYAGLIDYVEGDRANTPGTQRGQLPEGYTPLTGAQRDQGKAVAVKLRSEANCSPSAPGGADPQGNGSASSDTASSDPGATVPDSAVDPGANGPGGNAPATQTEMSAAAGEAGTKTPATVGQGAAVGGALAASVAGLLGTPFLLRRRGMGG